MMDDSFEAAAPAGKRQPPDMGSRGGHPVALPPHSLEAERGILACCLMDPQASVGRCIEKLRGKTEAFYDNTHRSIFEVISGMFSARKPVDLITLQEELKTAGKLEGLPGGIAYLSQMMEAVPSAANLDYYLDIVREKAALRFMVQACLKVVGEIRESSEDFQTLISGAQRQILSVVESEIPHSEKRLGQNFQKIIERIDTFRPGVKQLQGLSTGLNYFDNMTCGLAPAQYIAIAGRPGAGKTTLALQIAEHVAVDLGLPVAVFSLEMTGLALTTRQVFSRAGADFQKYRNGFMPRCDLVKLAKAMEEMKDAPFWIEELSGLTPEELSVKCRRLVHEKGVRLIVIDYIQLMRGSRGKRYSSRSEELSDCSIEIVKLKKELGIPIIVVAQMNREIEKDPKRKPQMSDLKDTGQIEQDADLIGLLYEANMKRAMDDPDSDEGKAQMDWMHSKSIQQLPEEFRQPKEWNKFLRRVNLLVAKQRDGPTGDVALCMVKSWVRLVDCFVPTKDGPGSEGGSRRGSTEGENWENANLAV